MYGIFAYIYHKKSTIHVGKYTSPMDGMGKASTCFTVSVFPFPVSVSGQSDIRPRGEFRGGSEGHRTGGVSRPKKSQPTGFNGEFNGCEWIILGGSSPVSKWLVTPIYKP